ncbi:MAG TPA: FkbM family methyltransferase [Acidimicrobiales bacterium]|jgi:FkbM family methyltransferase
MATNVHGVYCVPHSSHGRPAAQAVLAGQVWEPDTIAFLVEHATADVIHAGTYFGDFLPALDRAVPPDGRVWAFEPNPENHRCASITVALNGATSTRLHHAGVGARASTARLEVVDERGVPLGGGSRLVPDTRGNGTAVDIDVVAIDDVVPTDRVVSVIQLDVEGYEREALTGAMATIERCRPVLVVEQLDDVWLDEHLAPLGYRETGPGLHGNRVFAVEAERRRPLPST